MIAGSTANPGDSLGSGDMEIGVTAEKVLTGT